MKKILSLILIFIFSVASFAQVPPPPDQGVNASGGVGAQVEDSPSTPIDDILPILLVAGLTIGVYFVVKNPRKHIID